MSDLSNTELAERVANVIADAAAFANEYGAAVLYSDLKRADDYAVALLARLDAVTRELAKWQRVADGIERACQAAEADRDRHKAHATALADLSPEEARIVLIGLDAAREMGWDGAPYTATLQSATDKLEQQAGDRETTVHQLRQA